MLDYAKVKIKAGDGGKGLVGFRREKFVPKGGPNGGDGGRGGDLYIVATNSLATLLDFQFIDHFDAESGEPGGTSNKHGKDGHDYILEVPVGSIIRVNKLTVDMQTNKYRKGEERGPNKYEQKVFNYRRTESLKRNEALLTKEGQEGETASIESDEQPIAVITPEAVEDISKVNQRASNQDQEAQEDSFNIIDQESLSEEYKVYDFSNSRKSYASTHQARKSKNSFYEKDSPPEFDLSKEGMQIMIARGGAGGRGNTRFKNSIEKTPKFAEPGQKGEYLEIEIILKMVANVGLIGLPNAGKSTLLSKLTAASPKIANYAFTTLEPNLGVMRMEDGSRIVLADIPGLIEGASFGKGLGHRFLQHIERTQLLVHLIAIPDIQTDTAPEALRDEIVSTYDTVRGELERYGHDIPSKQEIIVINKIDKIPEDQRTKYIPLIEEAFKSKHRQFGFISAENELGLNGLKKLIQDALATEQDK
ncbi:MAG: 50S ribosome-binding GTPase [bacterium]|nr:50S ribosome-binding GTPase [bacterium]